MDDVPTRIDKRAIRAAKWMRDSEYIDTSKLYQTIATTEALVHALGRGLRFNQLKSLCCDCVNELWDPGDTLSVAGKRIENNSTTHPPRGKETSIVNITETQLQLRIRRSSFSICKFLVNRARKSANNSKDSRLSTRIASI